MVLCTSEGQPVSVVFYCSILRFLRGEHSVKTHFCFFFRGHIIFYDICELWHYDTQEQIQQASQWEVSRMGHPESNRNEGGALKYVQMFRRSWPSRNQSLISFLWLKSQKASAAHKQWTTDKSENTNIFFYPSVSFSKDPLSSPSPPPSALWGTEVFPIQLKDIISSSCPGSAP